MLADLKYFDGSVQGIERIPGELKRLYKTAFEIAPTGFCNVPPHDKNGSTNRRALTFGLLTRTPGRRALCIAKLGSAASKQPTISVP